MLKGISNFQIESAIKNLNDNDINENFIAVFPANHTNKFIDNNSLISDEKGKYPFLIANIDSAEKNSTHWWSILDIEPKTDLFFLFIWNWRFKKFYYSGRPKYNQKILTGIEKMMQKDNKLSLVNINFQWMLIKI